MITIRSIYTLYIFLVCFLFSRCQQDSDTRIVEPAKSFDVVWRENRANQYNQQITVIEIDSCEYLIGEYDRSRFLTHKGNCKFCTEGRKN